MHDLTSYLIDLMWFDQATGIDELRQWMDWFSFHFIFEPQF